MRYDPDDPDMNVRYHEHEGPRRYLWNVYRIGKRSVEKETPIGKLMLTLDESEDWTGGKVIDALKERGIVPKGSRAYYVEGWHGDSMTIYKGDKMTLWIERSVLQFPTP